MTDAPKPRELTPAEATHALEEFLATGGPLRSPHVSGVDFAAGADRTAYRCLCGARFDDGAAFLAHVSANHDG